MWASTGTESAQADQAGASNDDVDFEKEMDLDTVAVLNELADDVVRNEDDELEQLMDRETDAVMKERVAASTRTGYDGRNVSFMVWLFDGGEKYSHLFETSIYPKMEEAHANDKKRKTKSGRASKKRDYLRAA